MGAAVTAVAVAGGVSGVALASNPGPWAKPVVTSITSTTDSVTVTVAAQSGATFRYILADQGLHLVTGAKGPGDAAGYPGDGGTTSTTITWTGLSAGTAYQFDLAAIGGSRASSGWIPWHYVFTQGAPGAQGPAGKAGPAGPQGPSGVVATATKDLGSVASVPTGGSFVSRATQVGTVNLPAGTFVISLNAKATPPAGGTGATEVFPQFFVYNQPKNSSFSGDLFNVGAGALESGTYATIDSYYSGSTTITLPSATTLYVYAFGYDSDTGAGTYILDDLTITAIQVTPAG